MQVFLLFGWFLVNRKLKCSFSILAFLSVLVVFAKAIHCLSRIGDELYLEALSQGVSKGQHHH